MKCNTGKLLCCREQPSCMRVKPHEKAFLCTCTENRELSWCQLYRHWWHQRLSLWQWRQSWSDNSVFSLANECNDACQQVIWYFYVFFLMCWNNQLTNSILYGTIKVYLIKKKQKKKKQFWKIFVSYHADMPGKTNGQTGSPIGTDYIPSGPIGWEFDNKNNRNKPGVEWIFYRI